MKIQHYAPLTCYIPEAFNPEVDILCYNKRWKEKYVYFVHTILFSSLRSKQSFNGYVNLKGNIIQKFLGEAYASHVINQLVNSGVIEVNKKYSSGNFSKSYRLTRRFTKGLKIKRVTIDKQTYCRKVLFEQEKALQLMFKDNPLLSFEFHQMTKRRIDVQKAIDYINENYEEGTPQHATRLLAIDQFDKMKDAKLSNTLTNPIDFHFTYNKGRVYSPVTSLPRDLEKFTWFEGYDHVDSVSLDMPNSQLCFFDEYSRRNAFKVHNIGSVMNENIDVVRTDDELLFSGSGQTTKSILSSLISPPYDMRIENDLTWRDYIFNGNGYERMMFLSKWKGKTSDWTKEERQEFKGEFFGQLFYNKWCPKLTKMEVVYANYHEEESIILRSIKKKIGNSELAIQVQRLEAHVFHTLIVKHMKDNHRCVPFTIKHDSITLPMSEASYILDELNELVRTFFKVQWIQLKAEKL